MPVVVYPDVWPVWVAREESELHTWVAGNMLKGSLDVQVWGFSPSVSALQLQATIVMENRTESMALQQTSISGRQRTLRFTLPSHACSAWPCDALVSITDTLRQISMSFKYFKYPAPVLRSMFPTKGSEKGGALLSLLFMESAGQRTRQGAGLNNTLTNAAAKRASFEVSFSCQNGSDIKSVKSNSVSIMQGLNDEYTVQAQVPPSPCGAVDVDVHLLIAGKLMQITQGGSLKELSFTYVGTVIASVTPPSAMLNFGSGGAVVTITIANLDSHPGSDLNVTVGPHLCSIQSITFVEGVAGRTDILGRADIQVKVPEMDLSLAGEQSLKIVGNKLDLQSTFIYIRPPEPGIDKSSIAADGIKQGWVQAGKSFELSLRILNVARRYGFSMEKVGLLFADNKYNATELTTVGVHLDVKLSIRAPITASAAANISVIVYRSTKPEPVSVDRFEDGVRATVEVRDITEPMLVIWDFSPAHI
jgi:hypothetical protein